MSDHVYSAEDTGDMAIGGTVLVFLLALAFVGGVVAGHGCW